MRRKSWPLVAAGVAIATLVGCPPRAGGGGGPVVLASAAPTALGGDQRAFAEAYARAPWAVANLGAGDWPRALRDVTAMQDRLVALKRSRLAPERVRLMIAELQPDTDRLALLVQRREPAALPLAERLVSDYGRTAVQLSGSGWLAAGWGGGAGTGAAPVGVPAPVAPSP